MKYNGQELEPITKPQLFDPPKEMLVWDLDHHTPVIKAVWCIAPPAIYDVFPVMTTKGSHKHCAEIPQTEPKRATNIQLMEWLAKGNGIAKRGNNSSSRIFHYASFYEESFQEDVEDDILIRSFGSNEWLEPTLKNMGLEE